MTGRCVRRRVPATRCGIVLIRSVVRIPCGTQGVGTVTAGGGLRGIGGGGDDMGTRRGTPQTSGHELADGGGNGRGHVVGTLGVHAEGAQWGWARRGGELALRHRVQGGGDARTRGLPRSRRTTPAVVQRLLDALGARKHGQFMGRNVGGFLF